MPKHDDLEPKYGHCDPPNKPITQDEPEPPPPDPGDGGGPKDPPEGPGGD